MTKPVAPRAAAKRDAELIVASYANDEGVDIALSFIDAFEGAYRFIGDNPGAGSPRYGLILGIPGLRSWHVRGFPRLIFYVERADVMDVWRILHASRDVPATFVDPDATDEHQ